MFPIKDSIPSLHRPVAMPALIAVCVGIYLFQASLDDVQHLRFIQEFGLIPKRLTVPWWAIWQGLRPSWWPLLTSMFLHGSLFHLVSNMWILWIFGDNVEDRMGPIKFLIFYLICGVLAMLMHTFSGPQSTIPAVGASGAIAGVMGAYFIMFPHSMVVTFIPICFIPYFIPMPASIYLLFWFLIQVFNGAAALGNPLYGGGIAWWAHIGGFLAGILLFPFFLRPEYRKQPRPPRRRRSNQFPFEWPL